MATDRSRRHSTRHRSPAIWQLVALLAAGLMAGAAGGCDEESPTTQTIEPGDQVFYEYRDGRKRQVTDRRSGVPVEQRAATVVKSRDDRFAPVEGDDGQTRVWVANLLEAGTEGPVTARLRRRDHVIAARRAGGGAAEASSRLRTRAGEVVARAAADPFLWRIETDGRPVYLFGTVHRAEEGELDEMAPQVQEAFRASEVFVMETDTEAIPQYLQKLRTSELTYPSGQSLQGKLSEEQWDTLVGEFSGDVPVRALRKMRPWIVVARLSSLQANKSPDADEFMDVQLRDWAKTLDKEIRYLESPKDQFDAFREGFGLSTLRKMLEAPSSTRVGPTELFETYKRGDREALEQLMFENSITLSKGGSGYRELLVQRNDAWISEIEGYIDRGGVFIAAGCAHFIGPDSVVALLRERGHTVERVP